MGREENVKIAGNRQKRKREMEKSFQLQGKGSKTALVKKKGQGPFLNSEEKNLKER